MEIYQRLIKCPTITIEKLSYIYNENVIDNFTDILFIFIFVYLLVRRQQALSRNFISLYLSHKNTNYKWNNVFNFVKNIKIGEIKLFYFCSYRIYPLMFYLIRYSIFLCIRCWSSPRRIMYPITFWTALSGYFCFEKSCKIECSLT